MSKERFAMVSESMLSDPRLTKNQFKILCALRIFENKKLGYAHPKKSQIAAATNIHECKISAETRALESYGWIKKTGNGGSSTSSVYIVFDTPQTSTDSVQTNQHRFSAASKKQTSTDSLKNQHQIGIETSTDSLKNQHQIGAAQVTDKQQTSNRPITDKVTETEIIASKTRAKKALVPAKAGPVKIESLVTEFQTICRQTWESYATAYQIRYGIDPVRNAKVSAQVVQFCKRIPRDDAPHVAAHFVGSNSSFYVGKGHQFGNLLADAEKLRTEWATNRSMTTATARQIDATQTNFNSVEQALTMMQQRKQA